MKRIALIMALCTVVFAAQAQIDFSAEGLRYWRQTHQQRDASRHHLQSNIPLAPAPVATKGTQAAKSSATMPQNNVWFPGEWEEVQAIVVTPYYVYASPDGRYIADPLVEGVAEYYSSYYSRQASGHGPYISIMDTNNDSGIGDVSFYLMDAIQLGGAQAWVRVEEADDSAAVIRKLERMGLRHDNMRFLVAPGNSFWYRDCGPICFYYSDKDSVAMLDFEYYSGRALDDSLPVYIERQFGLPNFTTSIEWEGGNCLVDGAGMVISSDHIVSNNADQYGQLTWDGSNFNTINYQIKTPLNSAQVKDSLQRLIGPRAVYLLPAYQYDGGTGHVDLYADMLDENTFVFSVMPDAYSTWVDYRTGQKNMDSLCSYKSYFNENYRSNSIPFPSKDNGNNFSNQNDYTRYTRTYSNHTFVNNVIIQPCFSAVGTDGMPTASWDRANIEQVQRAYPGYTIYCVDVRGFDGSGGAIHCITKQIPAEHPIRILHNSIHGNTGTTYTTADATVRAEITNVDGIDSVVLRYRIDSGEWHSAPMTVAADGSYQGVMATQGATFSQYSTVEYYISATSLAGKTITKPMTAAQGGYFTFYLGRNPEVGIANVADAETRFGQFYPNPATDKADLVVDLAAGENYIVSIVDQMGRTVHTSGLQASGSIVYTINTQRLASGIYTVVFQNGNARVARKLIVQ